MGCLFSRTFVYAHPSGDMHQRSTQTKAFKADVLSKFEQSIADNWILHHLVWHKQKIQCKVPVVNVISTTQFFLLEGSEHRYWSIPWTWSRKERWKKKTSSQEYSDWSPLIAMFEQVTGSEFCLICKEEIPQHIELLYSILNCHYSIYCHLNHPLCQIHAVLDQPGLTWRLPSWPGLL